jgi:hypothetical protein
MPKVHTSVCMTVRCCENGVILSNGWDLCLRAKSVTHAESEFQRVRQCLNTLN